MHLPVNAHFACNELHKMKQERGEVVKSMQHAFNQFANVYEARSMDSIEQTREIFLAGNSSGSIACRAKGRMIFDPLSSEWIEIK